MEWTREKTLQLISEYRSRRGLWDMTCDEYRKKDVKQRLLNEVSQVLGGNIPINELEKKFHTLRTQYHREISRMKRMELYNCEWDGFQNLVFFNSPYACRSPKGSSEGGSAWPT
ncbi:GM12846 [Drosophila sechellia]|uniref:GM12846 n=1 Tax=Drosophila sechellia TaxID=7238 RepID=B4HZJ3_DROSE|nr:GM12846 [Drosophila sechellia]